MESTPKRIYFASDMHFGAPSPEESLLREKHFVKWLKFIQPTASELYLVGDLFDFWFEYKKAIPKGYVRFLGQLAEMADAGIKIHIFTGNHDLWYHTFFPEQIGATIHRKPLRKELFGHTFYMAHGDGLGPGDHGYKFMKWVFIHPLSKWLFARLHPNFGIGLADFFSGMSRNHPRDKEAVYHQEKEFLYIHSQLILQDQPDIQYFVYGHRHLAKDIEIAPGKKMIYLGDWIRYFTYLEVSPDDVQLKTYPMDSTEG